MSIPVTVNDYTFNFISDPTSPNGWDIAPASLLPMGLDQLTLWGEGNSAAQLTYDEALVTYWYTIESLADEFDSAGYATAIAAYVAAVGASNVAIYAPGSTAWVTFSNACLTMADT